MGTGLVGTLCIGLVRCHKRETHTLPVNLLWSAVTQLWSLPKLVTLVLITVPDYGMPLPRIYCA